MNLAELPMTIILRYLEIMDVWCKYSNLKNKIMRIVELCKYKEKRKIAGGAN